MKATLSALVVLVVLLIAPSFAISNTAAPSPAVPEGSAADLSAVFEPSKSLACTAKAEEPTDATHTARFDVATTIHCCGSGAGAACRDQCKQQGPGCKGTIGCRAGECVCTCSCP